MEKAWAPPASTITEISESDGASTRRLRRARTESRIQACCNLLEFLRPSNSFSSITGANARSVPPAPPRKRRVEAPGTPENCGLPHFQGGNFPRSSTALVLRENQISGNSRSLSGIGPGVAKSGLP
jgi:hypothetical protein